jgi:RNA polymerase sigma-70 factor (ECF subfamily)
MRAHGVQDGLIADVLGGGKDFPTTHWTLVTRVRHGGEVRQAALEELCGLYWYPIYAFLRRRGFAQHDAEDLTQGFFVKLLHDATFEAAEADKGRLRTFLLRSLLRHLADRHRQEHAQKRGGGLKTISFEAMNAEERYAHEPVDHRDPETLFTRAWVHLLLDSVRDRLRGEFAEMGRAGVFETLLPFLLGDEAAPSYREVGQKLEASETAVRLLVFRLRGRFRDRLREEVSRTVLDPADVPGELDWLKSVLTKS